MWPFRKREQRASLEDPRVPLSDPGALAALLGEAWMSATGEEVTPERALGVPAVWCAINFIAGTIAALPLQLYKGDGEDRQLAKADPLYSILHDVVNDDQLTSFKWRKMAMASTLLTGRSFTFIERNKAGRVMNLWPLVPKHTTIRRNGGKTVYEYQQSETTKVTYSASEIIDIPFLLHADGVCHENPTQRLKNALALAIAMEVYAAKFFQNGGVPPLSVQGPAASQPAMKRTKEDVLGAVKRSNKENANVLYMPTGFELKPVGFNPEQGQLTEARLFQLQEIARIYDLPPIFLQDLSKGTYSNTEQQDLAFVKHTLTQWLELWEQELNAKLFSRRNRQNFVEFNVDGLLRGDFKTRMDGYSTAIQNALLTPDEARALENRPAKGGPADKLHIQGATVPLGQQVQRGAEPTPPQPSEGTEE